MNTDHSPRSTSTRSTIEADAASRVERATMLPPRAFVDPGVFDWELETIFRGWVCVGHVSAVAEPGKLPDARDRHRQRGRDRRRGRAPARLPQRLPPPRRAARSRRPRAASAGGSSAPTTAGRTASTASCKAAPHMDGVEDFDPSCWGLIAGPGRGRRRPGAGRPQRRGARRSSRTSASWPATSSATASATLAAPARLEYEVAANWKGIAENYSECLHCPGRPPGAQRAQRLHERRGDGGRGRLVRRLDDPARRRLDDGRATGGHASSTGRRSRASPASDLTLGPLLRAVPERARLAAPRLRDAPHPVAARGRPHRRRSASGSSSRRRSPAEGFDPSDAIGFWDQVNREDWHVCELTSKGVRTRGYVAGRYSAEEVDVHAFDLMVADRYMEALRERVEVPA